MSAFPTHSAAVPAEPTFTTSDFSLVDSHCHLDFFLAERNNGKRDSYSGGSGGSKLPQLSEVLARAYRANIRTLLTINTDFSQQPSLVSLCEKYEQQTHTATAETATVTAMAMASTRTSASDDNGNLASFLLCGHAPD